MKHWYQYRSKDRKVKGIIPARDENEVAHLAGYQREELVIERVKWNGREFISEKSNSVH